MSSERLLVADVVIDAKTAGSDAEFTYLAPPDAAVGEARLVPIGPRQALGHVFAVRRVTADELGFDPKRLRPLGPRVADADLTPGLVKLIQEVAEDCLAPRGAVLGLASPPGIRDRLAVAWRPTRPAGPDEKLNAAEQEALAVMTELGEVVDAKGDRLADGMKRILRRLEAQGLAVRATRLTSPTERRKIPGRFRLTRDASAIEGFLAKESRRSPAQAMTLVRLQGSEGAAFTASEIRSLAGVTDQTIRALAKAGLLEPAPSEDQSATAPPEPNERQAAAISAISAAIRARESKGFLLFGVTGSGKTEVFLRSAAEALSRGRTVLYLVPEIALTAQVAGQLRSRFGDRVAILHSNLSPAERLEAWLRIRRGETPVVLGARSAAFAPLEEIGLIVLDEEHEGSYKQDTSPRYHAKSVAARLAAIHGCPYVLGSATPSIETFSDALDGPLTLLRLPARAAEAARLPEVLIEDLGAGFRGRTPALFTPALQEALIQEVGAGRQAILFLNRRAYAPSLVCRDCGHRPSCDSCAVSLSFHRRLERLRCHHCGKDEPVPPLCPSCGSTRLAPFGVGAQRVEEEAAMLLPNAVVARLDRDAVRVKGVLEETLARFRAGEIQVLVGTQMVAKGLDFPNVTLVGVVAADVSLSVPDFRATERTFQLLSQVAGRAGRGKWPGRVIIQTLAPEEPAIVMARDHDYEAFFRRLAEQRSEAGYPPFRRLVRLLFTGEDQKAVTAASESAARRLRTALREAEIIGPANCPLERLNGHWRRHLLVKLEPSASPAPVAAAVEGGLSPAVRMIIDVDPMSLV